MLSRFSAFVPGRPESRHTLAGSIGFTPAYVHGEFNVPTVHEIYDQADQLKDQGKLDSSFALAHSALAVVLGRLGRHEEAIRHGQQVCELEPNEPFSFTALSVTYQRAGRIPEAEDAMYKARMMDQQGR